jgi:hypothetical protein
MSLSLRNERNFKIGDIIRYKYTENSDWHMILDIDKNGYLTTTWLESKNPFQIFIFHPNNALLIEDSNAKLV